MGAHRTEHPDDIRRGSIPPRSQTAAAVAFRLFPTLPVAAGGGGTTLVVLGARRGNPVIALSRDAGRTFRVRSSPVLVERLGRRRGRPAIAAIDNRGRLHRSRDGGRHFRTVLRAVSALAVDPDRRGHWYAARGSRLSVTTDGGATWRLVQSPPGAPVISALSACAGRLWVGTRDGIFSRIAGGERVRRAAGLAGAVLARCSRQQRWHRRSGMAAPPVSLVRCWHWCSRQQRWHRRSGMAEAHPMGWRRQG